MKIFSSKRRMGVAAVLVLLVLFLARPGASRLKSRIIGSLSAAVGRPVDLSSVHLRLLPHPGFDLENLVVYDDPSFGPEPMLRASEVTANLRLTSLLRGRLEVSRLELTEPSLNLVHHVGGGWNLESLLERTSRMPLAPTGKVKSEPRPGFPYIEGTSGRINFKNGPEKKAYALTNADFALWQDSENTWGVRLKAQPFRSDMNLNDTGLLLVNGTWQRAASFGETPLQFNMEWSQAQLGQLTKFFAGNDKGWRGDVRVDANLTGTPAALKISSTFFAVDFRRYDITSEQSLSLNAHCEAEYRAHDHEFRQIVCTGPVGGGFLMLTGDAAIAGSHRYALTISAQDVPADAIAALARRLKKDLPDDLTAEGILQGRMSITEDGAPGGPRFQGHGEIANLQVSSESNKSEMGPQTIPFVIGDSAGERRPTGSAPRLELGPFPMEKARGGGAILRGSVDRSGYTFTVSGDAEIGKTLRRARMFGLRALHSTAEGAAQLNLRIFGSWMSQGGSAVFAGPQVTGTARLRNVRFGLRGNGQPVEIASAEMQISQDEVRVQQISARAAGATWKGWLELPRGCGSPDACSIRFQLNTNEVALNEASEWADLSPKGRPWYRMLDTAQIPPSLLLRVRASGRLSADRFVIRSVTATKVAANVSLDAGKIKISTLEADLLGGKHRGKWQADFNTIPVKCGGSGELAGTSLGGLSKLMKDVWIEGTGTISFEIGSSCTPDFWQRSEGTLQVKAFDGSLPHVFLSDSEESLKFRKLSAQGRLQAGEIDVSNGTLDSPDGEYELHGTATLKREIDFNLVRVPKSAGSNAYSITGTLAQPRVSPVGKTEQARLKTPASK